MQFGLKRSAQVQYNYNKLQLYKIFFLVLQSACADCCYYSKTFALCYCSCIVVVLHLCGPL